MPPWTIVLASTAAAIAAAAALAIPQMAAGPRFEIGMALLPQLPALAVATLGVYGLVALSLTTTGLVASVLRVRHHLARTEFGRAVTRHDWITLFAASGFRPLASMPGGPETADDSTAVHARLTVSEARGEIARRHYISLARTHFFSVLIVLVGIVGLGAGQELGTLPFRTGAIPTVSAILIVVGLLLLALLGRIAVDVAAEPLLETIVQPPAEPAEAGLLRRIVALQEAARNGAAGGEAISHLPDRFPEQLAAAFEQGYRPLLDVVGNLSENSRALEAAVRSTIEAIDAQQRFVDNKIPGLAALPDLQIAVEELIAVLRQLSAAPHHAEEPPFAAGAVPSRRMAPAPGLARELRRLLQEIDAAR